MCARDQASATVQVGAFVLLGCYTAWVCRCLSMFPNSPSTPSLRFKQSKKNAGQLSQDKVLTKGGDLRFAQVDVPLSVSHTCV